MYKYTVHSVELVTTIQVVTTVQVYSSQCTTKVTTVQRYRSQCATIVTTGTVLYTVQFIVYTTIVTMVQVFTVHNYSNYCALCKCTVHTSYCTQLVTTVQCVYSFVYTFLEGRLFENYAAARSFMAIRNTMILAVSL